MEKHFYDILEFNPNSNAQDWKQGQTEKWLSAVQICEISA